jgi:hypothetical protein
MPTATYTPLATVTLGTATSSVTFSSIPATYRDLILVMDSLNSSGIEQLKLTLNSDTGSNYPYVSMRGNGSSALSSSSSANPFALLDESAFANATNRHIHNVSIMDYSATDKHKTLLSRANNAAIATDAIAIRWASTSAVTSINIFYQLGNINSGSTFNLYGVIA